MTIEIDRYDYDADQRVLDQENEAKNAPKRSHTKRHLIKLDYSGRSVRWH